MAKLTEKKVKKVKKVKKSWDFSALSDSDGPGSSHELDSFPLEIEKAKPEAKKKSVAVDPLAFLTDNTSKADKLENKKSVKKEKDISAEKIKTVINKNEGTNLNKNIEEQSISSFLKKEAAPIESKNEEKIILEPEIVKPSANEMSNDKPEESICVARMIKPKPASEQEEIEDSVESVPLDSAQIAKQRLSYDLLKRPFSDTDFIHRSTQLVPTVKEVEIKKKELFSPWYSVPSDERNKTYIFTVLLMLAMMGIGSSLIL